MGLSEVPDAGDQFYAVADERLARELAEQRRQKERLEQSGQVAQKVSLEDLYAQIQKGQVKELSIIVKADVQGSV
jgi:translation initiation factor IF-2